MTTKIKVIIDKVSAGNAVNVDSIEGRKSLGQGEYEYTLEPGQDLRFAEAPAAKEPDEQTEDEVADAEVGKQKSRRK